jgi:hypothetical protein
VVWADTGTLAQAKTVRVPLTKRNAKKLQRFEDLCDTPSNNKCGEIITIVFETISKSVLKTVLKTVHCVRWFSTQRPKQFSKQLSSVPLGTQVFEAS